VASTASEKAGQTAPFYQGFVLLRIRRPSTGFFAGVNAGVRGLQLTIDNDGVITLAHPSLPRWLNWLFGFEHSRVASETLMRRQTVGWLGSSPFARASIVLTDARGQEETELAIAPKDGDLERLARALTLAGSPASD
jgi:hypothetical protein